MEREDEELTAGRKRLGLIGMAMLLAVTVGAAVWYLLFSQPEPTPEEIALERTSGPVQYLDIEPSFLINFPHQGRQRYLQTNISVMSRDEEALQAVTYHMPAIRHQLNIVLSARILLVFEDPSGIEALRQLAVEEVQQVLLREIGREGIDDLLFTSFVMQ